MDSVYVRLAAKLDGLPQGFPASESGVELRILEKIFTPEEAALACDLLPIPETAVAVARRLGLPKEEARARLESMADRGEIMSFRKGGRQRYMVAPFVFGIYEFQLPRMDTELAEMFEEYAPTLLETVGGRGPAIARVLPVNVSIDARLEVLRHEDLRGMMEKARSFRLMECVCRTERAAIGSPCSHPLETCLAFSSEPDAFNSSLPYGRLVTREEALDVLARCEREGLVHCTYNVRLESMFVCNCCPCCCGLLRGIKEFGAPHMLAHSASVAEITPEICTACAACAEGRCPMDAIVPHDGVFRVEAQRCIGCGVCTVVCPSDAITLAHRPQDERPLPPHDVVTWSLRRASNRFGPWHTARYLGATAIEATRTRKPRSRAAAPPRD